MKKMMMILSILGIAVLGINNANAQNCCGDKKTGCTKKTNSTDQTSTAQASTVRNKATAEVVNDSLIVNGKCGMCKSRIEKTAKGIKGVTDAQWDQSTHILIYTYTGTVKKEDVSNALITVGHDTEYGKAQDKVYNKLPACCKYRS